LAPLKPARLLARALIAISASWCWPDEGDAKTLQLFMAQSEIEFL
jgi:hypothetical protein